MEALPESLSEKLKLRQELTFDPRTQSIMSGFCNCVV